MYKNFYVFQDWVARCLAEEGFTYVCRPDKKDDSKMVYIFENSEELKAAFDIIMSRTPQQ